MALHTVSVTLPTNSFREGLHTGSKTNSVHHQTCLPRNVTATAGLMELPSLNAKKLLKQLSELKEAVDISRTDFRSYGVILRKCARSKDLRQGKGFHAHLIHTGFERDTFIGNSLISMYMKCDSLVDACHMFDKMPERDVITWNAMIAGYSTCGQFGKAVQLFCEMQQEQLKPDRSTFVSLLKACVSSPDVEQVHALVVRTGFSLDVHVANVLVDIYTKCGGLLQARQVFDDMPERNVVSWSSMITAYTQNDHGDAAFDIFYEMCMTGVKPDKFTFSSALTACGCQGAIEEGLAVHASCIKTGVSFDAFVRSALIAMYMKCGKIEQACKVFGKKPEQNMVYWNAMIAGYMQNGYSEEALSLFHQMRVMGLKCDQFTIASVLSARADLIAIEEGRQGLHTGSKTNSVHHQTCLPRNVTATAGLTESPGLSAKKLLMQVSELKEAVHISRTDFRSYGVILQECACSKDLRQGKRFHAHLIHTGFERDTFIGNSLVSMYMKCDSLVDARNMFDNMPERNVITWSAMIAGYSTCGQFGKAVQLFCEMQQEQLKPNRSTFASLLKGCVSTPDVEKVHALVIRTGLSLDVHVANVLVDIYTKCGGLLQARQVFDDMPERNVVSWNSMITAYTQNDHGEEAFDIFCEMCMTGVKPDKFTFSSALTACGCQGAIKEGLAVHASCIKNGVSLDAFVRSALITMYMKCGKIEQACKVFGKKPEQNMVSWTAMIAGHMQNGHSEEALSLFHQMQVMGLRCNQFTFASVLSACADLIAIEEGRQVHTHVIKTGFESAICVVTALLTMYAKGKCTDDAVKVFTKLHGLDSFLWAAMISAYAQNEKCESPVQLFHEMHRENIMLDESTFASVVTVECETQQSPLFSLQVFWLLIFQIMLLCLFIKGC